MILVGTSTEAKAGLRDSEQQQEELLMNFPDRWLAYQERKSTFVL